ncbi:MAG: fibronectin type III domain-containing protein [Verrucomicrobiae bacterium]|nr:fibronectin type III domain-containing protein [Verrucomicrobiae bacterium]
MRFAKLPGFRKVPAPGWRICCLAGLLGVAWPVVAAPLPAPLVAEGTQYAPAGNPLGDQLAPSLAFRANGGCLVWHDNLTDGDGFGVSARRLSGQLSGLSSLRVNEDGTGDQQNPRVAILNDGSNLIVWQSGVRGSQVIRARVLRADGQFAGSEFTLSGPGTDHKDPDLAVAGDGTVLVVWTADGVDGDMSAVVARRLTASGQTAGEPFLVNQTEPANQRDPVVCATGNGGLVVSWISEQQRFFNSVDVYARRLAPDGSFVGDEFLVNTSRRPCATPAIAGLPGGGFMVAWSEHQDVNTRWTWDVYGRVWGDTQPKGADFLINTRQRGYQLMPRLAVSGDAALVIYRSEDGDGYSEGVVGQWLSVDGGRLGDEFVVNTKTAGDQLTPTVAADASGRLIVVWSTFNGVVRGMDLAAQRFARAQAPLPAPGAPYLFAASASRLMITWPEVSGLPVAGYDVFVDGASTPVRTVQAGYSLGGLPPSSTHSVRIAYVLADGRVSPVSEPAEATTWGEDDNADGLPDDWQRKYFGNNPALWPSPATDSDGDGVSNRNEFLAGTDPTDPGSVLLVSVVDTPQGPLLVWNTRAGGVYQPQWSGDLRNWSDMGLPRLAAGASDSAPAGDSPANVYYRVNFLR